MPGERGDSPRYDGDQPQSHEQAVQVKPQADAYRQGNVDSDQDEESSLRPSRRIVRAQADFGPDHQTDEAQKRA